MSKSGLLKGTGIGKLKFYESYVMCKQRRVKFSSGKHTSTGILEYIHSNLWGLARVKCDSLNLGGHFFFFFCYWTSLSG